MTGEIFSEYCGILLDIYSTFCDTGCSINWSH